MFTRAMVFSFCVAGILAVSSLEVLAHDHSVHFDVLHTFDVADATTGASPTGSQPDTRPAIGRDGSIYGMTYLGGPNGTGVIYRYRDGHYKVLHAFGALDANGNNADGANPGVAITVGPDNVFYGMASFGGLYGSGTVFSFTAEGHFKVLHNFSALSSTGTNEDGAAPLRTIIIGSDGNLYGTTRIGGLAGLGVAWVMNKAGAFSVIHEFQPQDGGHVASLTEGHDGYLYGCTVFPTPQKGVGALYRMSPSGGHFEVLYRFTPANAQGENPDGADCFEPLTEVKPGVFVGAGRAGGPNGTGVVFAYSLSHPGKVSILHAFSALNASGENPDGASPYARLSVGDAGNLYSTTAAGGATGNGVVYRLRLDGQFKVLWTFSAVDPVTGANRDGSDPDYGVTRDGDDSWVGIADYGGSGSKAGGTGNGTLYRLHVDDDNDE